MANKANFEFNANDLSVTFSDRSSGTIANRLWKFGFQDQGAEKTSTEQNPTIDFPAAGKYTVSLSINDGESTETVILLLSAEGINYSVEQWIKNEMPQGVPFGSLSQEIKKWQVYLNNGMPNPLSDADIFKQEKWPFLANLLIAKLVIYDVVISAARQFIAAAASGNSSNVTTGSSGSTPSAKGAIKRIETGPSNVEWYDGSAVWTNIMKAGSSNSTSSGAPGSFMDLIVSDICMYAKSFGIRLPMCKYGTKFNGLILAKRPQQTFYRDGFYIGRG